VSKHRKTYGRIEVPGYPPANVTQLTVAVYIAAQQQEIERLQALVGERGKSLIVLPGGAAN
jgi:hypothetical protein